MNDTTPTPAPRGPSAMSHGLVAGSALAAIALIVGVWIVQGGSLTSMRATPAESAGVAPSRAMPGPVPMAAPRMAAPASPARAALPAQAQLQMPVAAHHPTPWADPRLFQQWAAMAGTYAYPLNYMTASQAMFMNAMRAWHAQVQPPTAAAHASPPPPRG